MADQSSASTGVRARLRSRVRRSGGACGPSPFVRRRLHRLFGRSCRACRLSRWIRVVISRCRHDDAKRGVEVGGASREPIVPREPGAPGPRPWGTWVGTGGANPLEPEAALNDRRGGESWDVEITFENERIGIRYPSLGCEGEPTPVAYSSRRLEYAERLSQGCGNAWLARWGRIVLERTAENSLWYNWHGRAGVGATASLRPR